MKREELPVIETHIPYGNRITGTAFASFSPGPGGDTPATAQNGGERKNITIYPNSTERGSLGNKKLSRLGASSVRSGWAGTLPGGRNRPPSGRPRPTNRRPPARGGGRHLARVPGATPPPLRRYFPTRHPWGPQCINFQLENEQTGWTLS